MDSSSNSAECVDFMGDVLSYMGALGLEGLDGSGLRFPAVGWGWGECCRVCVWLAFMGYELPGNLKSRLFLGPGDPSVALYLEWLRHKSGVGLPGETSGFPG